MKLWMTDSIVERLGMVFLDELGPQSAFSDSFVAYADISPSGSPVVEVQPSFKVAS